MRKISILSLSLLTLMAGAAVSPILSLISQYYSNDSIFIKLLVTIPSILVIVVSLFLSKFLLKIFSKKHWY